MKRRVIVLITVAIISTILLSFLVSQQFILILPVWFGSGIFAYAKSSEEERGRIAVLLFLYPVIETLLKVWVILNIVPYSWIYINRLEHFIGAIFITLIFSRIAKIFLKQESTVVIATIVILSALTLGMFNEIFEYYVRAILLSDLPLTPLDVYYSPENAGSRGWIYYYDSIFDLIVNTGGVTITTLIIYRKGVLRNLGRRLSNLQ